MKWAQLLSAFSLLSLAAAVPLEAGGNGDVGGAVASVMSAGAAGKLTADTLLASGAAAKACDKKLEFPTECRTLAEAAGPIQKSFSTYKIKCPNEKAALISLMIYESGSFTWSKNHFPAPGTPGQGTRNMQGIKFNTMYAQAAVPEKLKALGEKADPAKVLDSVNDDEHGFGSAAWFMTTQCKTETRKQLQKGTLAGWHAFIKDCVGTDPADDRDVIWQKAHSQVGKGIK